MKKLIIILLLSTLFAASCQTKADNIETKPDRNIYKIPNIQAETSPKSESDQQDINLKIGIVDGSIENICFRTKNDGLIENTTVSIVTSLDELPQKILNAVVGRKLEEVCSRRASDSTDKNRGKNFYYSLTLKNKQFDEYQEVFGIGVIEPETPFQFQNNLASIDLNNDGKPEFFRLCAGNEGVLLAVWTGKPLIGKQIWNSFYYLDYDTEPNCKKEDS